MNITELKFSNNSIGSISSNNNSSGFDTTSAALDRNDESASSLVRHIQTILPNDELDEDMITHAMNKAVALAKTGVIENTYVGRSKKDEKSYSFCVTPKNEIIIAFDVSAEGKHKKVSHTYNTTNPEQQLVKIVVRGGQVENLKNEFMFQEMFYEIDQNLFMKPSEIRIYKDVLKNNLLMPKCIYFEQDISFSGDDLFPDEIKKIARFCHDIAKAASVMHRLQFVHCDIKPGNGLWDEVSGSSMLIDFGYTRPTGTEPGGGTQAFVPPEFLQVVKTLPDGIKKIGPLPADQRPKVTPSFDSFSLGVTVLEMLMNNFPVYCEQEYKVSHLGFLTPEERKDLFTRLKVHTQQNEESFSKEKVALKEKLLELADRLTVSEPDKRISCEQFYLELEAFAKVEKNVNNNSLA